MQQGELMRSVSEFFSRVVMHLLALVTTTRQTMIQHDSMSFLALLAVCLVPFWR